MEQLKVLFTSFRLTKRPICTCRTVQAEFLYVNHVYILAVFHNEKCRVVCVYVYICCP
jgi:hypothetical protein